MTEKRTIKVCPNCGSCVIYHARRKHLFTCNNCRNMFVTPLIREAMSQKYQTPPYIKYAVEIYEAYKNDPNFSYQRYSEKLAISPSTVQKAVRYAKTQRELIAC